MKKIFIIALVAVATIVAVSCGKDDPVEEQTLKLPGTSWAYNLETTVMDQTLVFNDTLNVVDDKNIERSASFVVGERERNAQDSYGYTWDGKVLTLLDSVGEPTHMVCNYNAQNNTFYRDMSDADDEMNSIFQMLGITEMPYRQIR